ncbi:MAG: 16S rRNA (cytosine(1402)-N(4))-methyltransferase RsmH [Gemmatimonadota bacterium]
MTVAGWLVGGRRPRGRAVQAPTVTRRQRTQYRQWTGARGRDVWGLGVGHTRLSTASFLIRCDAVGRRRRAPRGRGLKRDCKAGCSVSSFHQPALQNEAMDLLAPPGTAAGAGAGAGARASTYLDATVGGGGHAEVLLSAREGIKLLAIDKDPEAVAHSGRRLEAFGGRVDFRTGDYADAGELFGLGEGTLAGVFVDLGVSSHQIDSLERGFTFKRGAPLDMRMPGGSSDASTAADLLNRLSKEELTTIFRRYGEVRRAQRLAAEIVERRHSRPLSTSDDLLQVVQAVWRRSPEPSQLAPLFQALRIAVNRELESLERALPSFRDLLQPRGRLVVIAYHSLEDRLVKRAFREWSQDCVCPPDFPVCRCRGRALGVGLTRRPIRASEEEVSRNQRARSARLRAWEKADSEPEAGVGSDA